MAKGRGRTTIGTWDRCVADLAARKSRFRLCRRSSTAFIQVRELEDGKVLREFSTQVYRVDDEDDIESAYRLCIRSHEVESWQAVDGGTLTADRMSWEAFALLVGKNLEARVPREASRRDTEGHLKSIARFKGEVSSARLFKWATEVDPIEQFHPFKKRIETLSHIQASGLLEVKKELEKLRSMKPKGSAKKRQELLTLKPKAIPLDQELQDWLDGLEDDLLQWTFALIATYGLRPSEAWHAEGIDEKGWITIPGDGKTKTDLHFAPPVPEAWLERYQLRERFEEMSRRLNERWRIRWAEVQGVRVPLNNSQCANQLYKQFQHRGLKKLMAERFEHPEERDWVRPYDLRHSYAIRCHGHEETRSVPTDQFAEWMGHGVEVHRRTYLRWMSQERRKEAVTGRREHFTTQTLERPSEGPLELPEEILKKLAKLEKLEKLLAGD